MLRSSSISTESELQEFWSDINVPNIAWGFNETSLDECVQIGETTWEATYETLEITSGSTYTSTYLSGSQQLTYTLQAGEYGIKPD